MGTLLAKNDGEGRELTYVATTTKRQSLKMENAKNRMRKRERVSCKENFEDRDRTGKTVMTDVSSCSHAFMCMLSYVHLLAYVYACMFVRKMKLFTFYSSQNCSKTSSYA